MDDATLLSWIDRGRTLSYLLVAVGVVGEFFVDRISGPIIKRRDVAQQAEIARFNREAREANERSLKLEIEAAQQRERAAKSERDLLTLQQRLAPRRINSTEHSIFVSALKPFAGATVEITKLGDAEAGQFADDIIAIFTEAKWNLQLTTVGSYSPPPYGLQCAINQEKPAGKVLAAIAEKLPTAHIDSVPELPTVARILVGLKPPP
jgi:hypothetical protein